MAISNNLLTKKAKQIHFVMKEKRQLFECKFSHGWLTDYVVADVFNFDETALFWKLQPNCTLRDQHMNDKKKCKDRLTIGLAANMDGSEKCHPLFINKFKKPRAFLPRNINLRFSPIWESIGMLIAKHEWLKLYSVG